MKKRILIIISTLIIITGLTSIAYAFYISKDKANNKFTVGNLTENINEDFKEPDSWNGQKISKKAWVENTNTMPEIIRVAIEPRFEDKDGNFFSGNINYIKFNYANVTTNINDKNKWYYGDDGYYYYTSVVYKGEKTSNIINSLKFNGPDSEKATYEGLNLKAVIRSEALFSAVDSWKKDWKVDENNKKLVALLNNLNKDPINKDSTNN